MPVSIQTYVILDLETTGLPWQENNQTKIIELCALTMSRAQILRTRHGQQPDAEIYQQFLNPGRRLSPKIVKMTGITNHFLRDLCSFEDIYDDFEEYLNSLPRPVCIVAHNGNKFDYKILLAEINDAGRRFPNHIYCADSLVAFRELDKYTAPSTTNAEDPSFANDWPDLDVSLEDWQEIDDICQGPSHVPHVTTASIGYLVVEPIQPKHGKAQGKNRKTKQAKQTAQQPIEQKLYNLSSLYRRMLNEEPMNAHHAVDDCTMLLKCIIAAKNDFLPWVDYNCKRLCDIKPLIRPKYI